MAADTYCPTCANLLLGAYGITAPNLLVLTDLPSYWLYVTKVVRMCLQ